MGMDYLIRLVQAHESFRLAELEALAKHEKVNIEIIEYREDSPFCIIRFPHVSGASSIAVARSFASRSILSKGIYELWGQGTTYDELHEDIRDRSFTLWPHYRNVSFRFLIDAYCGKRSLEQQRDIVESFRYLDFEGKIDMKNAAAEFKIFEEWHHPNSLKLHPEDENLATNNQIHIEPKRTPKRLFFGRYVGGTRRQLIEKHDLKKRPYISTTSMDAELALTTANLALAGPGKVFLDPFVGTGGFMVAASEFGSWTVGSDIDGRSFRGKGPGPHSGVGKNFQKYALESLFGDCIASDLTNTAFRLQQGYSAHSHRWLDGIVCDPPYGIREGLKVLGMRRSKETRALALLRGQIGEDEAETSGDNIDPSPLQPHLIGGVPGHKLPGYIPPKKPYSFIRMLDDILDFAARTLVEGGRLAFWMPSANELDQELSLPQHPLLHLKHVCVQAFNKWSRRLLVYERKPGNAGSEDPAIANKAQVNGKTADELNDFRRRYFQGFNNA